MRACILSGTTTSDNTMFKFLAKFFGANGKTVDEPDEKLAGEWYEEKTKLMEKILGREHDQVMHAVVPYAIGGFLDLYYYFPRSIPGTAVATKELSELPNRGS